MKKRYFTLFIVIILLTLTGISNVAFASDVDNIWNPAISFDMSISDVINVYDDYSQSENDLYQQVLSPDNKVTIGNMYEGSLKFTFDDDGILEHINYSYFPENYKPGTSSAQENAYNVFCGIFTTRFGNPAYSNNAVGSGLFDPVYYLRHDHVPDNTNFNYFFGQVFEMSEWIVDEKNNIHVCISRCEKNFGYNSSVAFDFYPVMIDIVRLSTTSSNANTENKIDTSILNTMTYYLADFNSYSSTYNSMDAIDKNKESFAAAIAIDLAYNGWAVDVEKDILFSYQLQDKADDRTFVELIYHLANSNDSIFVSYRVELQGFTYSTVKNLNPEELSVIRKAEWDSLNYQKLNSGLVNFYVSMMLN